MISTSPMTPPAGKAFHIQSVDSTAMPSFLGNSFLSWFMFLRVLALTLTIGVFLRKFRESLCSTDLDIDNESRNADMEK